MSETDWVLCVICELFTENQSVDARRKILDTRAGELLRVVTSYIRIPASFLRVLAIRKDA